MTLNVSDSFRIRFRQFRVEFELTHFLKEIAEYFSDKKTIYLNVMSVYVFFFTEISGKMLHASVCNLNSAGLYLLPTGYGVVLHPRVSFVCVVIYNV